MIVFLNFAPLSFGGGAERWMASVADDLSKKEPVTVLTVKASIADIYARLILHRNFDPRMKNEQTRYGTEEVSWLALVPLTTDWQRVRSSIKEARVIYTRLELNELFLLLHFGGMSAIRKSIIGLHSPFFYVHSPLSFFERLHNFVYRSFLVRYLLAQARHIHVLNPSQEQILRSEFGISHVSLIPNFIENPGGAVRKTDPDALRVCFTGELSERKGADLLIKIIGASPKTFFFDVAGDGYLKADLSELHSKILRYHGYVGQDEISMILNSCDVLLLPSRAESFSLASLDALSRGLVVVCSPDISPNMLEKYLVINHSGTIREYLSILQTLHTQKSQGKLWKKRQETAAEIKQLFSKDEILNRLKKELFIEKSEK